MIQINKCKDIKIHLQFFMKLDPTLFFVFEKEIGGAHNSTESLILIFFVVFISQINIK